MVESNITNTQWLNTINTYFTGYYMNESERVKRRRYRALYLSNIDYLNSNRNLNNNIKKNIIMWNNWYIIYYNRNVITSMNNNKMP